MHKTRELVAQAAFDELRGAETEPGPEVRTDKEIRQWIRHTMSTDFHPCGTCRMGVGEDAVVDAQMRVHGCTGLRVVDASIMPRIVSGNLNAPVQMLAGRAAGLYSRPCAIETTDSGICFSDNMTPCIH